jgi:hypothetical protein
MNIRAAHLEQTHHCLYPRRHCHDLVVAAVPTTADGVVTAAAIASSVSAFLFSITAISAATQTVSSSRALCSSCQAAVADPTIGARHHVSCLPFSDLKATFSLVIDECHLDNGLDSPGDQLPKQSGIHL